jgi:Protein of unknown function (DUF3396)
MTTLDPNDVSELAKLLCIRDKNGRPLLRVGLLATMFFPDPWTRPAREAVTEVAEMYIQQFRSHLRWTQNSSGHIYPIDIGEVPFPRDWLPQHEDGQSWQFGFHGGESDEAASEFQVSGYGPSSVRKDKLGYFQIYLPLTWFTEHPGATFPDFVLHLAKRLRPVSGYAGIGVLESIDFDARQTSGDIVRRIAERFPGLEIEDCIGHAIYARKGIKGVNWLNVLGDRWAHEIGGLDHLRTRLGDDFKLIAYDGGLMIQAGAYPQIGDVTANRWPRHYVTVAEVLKPIQVKDHGEFHWGNGIGVQKRMDHDASVAWLFRFDGK